MGNWDARFIREDRTVWILSERGDLINLALHKAVVKEEATQPDQFVVRTQDGVHIASLPSEQHADDLIEEVAVNIMKGTPCIDLGIRIKQLQNKPDFGYPREMALDCGMS